MNIVDELTRSLISHCCPPTHAYRLLHVRPGRWRFSRLYRQERQQRAADKTSHWRSYCQSNHRMESFWRHLLRPSTRHRWRGWNDWVGFNGSLTLERSYETGRDNYSKPASQKVFLLAIGMAKPSIDLKCHGGDYNPHTPINTLFIMCIFFISRKQSIDWLGRLYVPHDVASLSMWGGSKNPTLVSPPVQCVTCDMSLLLVNTIKFILHGSRICTGF